MGGRAHGGGAKGGHGADATMLHFAACASVIVTSGDLGAAGFAHQSYIITSKEPFLSVGVASSPVINLKPLAGDQGRHF